MTPPFTMLGSSVAKVEQSKHKDFPQGLSSLPQESDCYRLIKLYCNELEQFCGITF
jgi:hypothetical protein